MYRTAPFVQLGLLIDSILNDHPAVLEELVRLARLDNPWFTAQSVTLALKSLSQKMLRREKLQEWLEAYPYPADFEAKKVGIVMAGNIPLVGFLDLLCVCVAGHRAYVKTSSKDKALMNRAVKALLVADRTLSIQPLTEQVALDAVIATGSDNTNRYFKRMYGDIPHLLRGNRTSITVLDGTEAAADLRGLSHDIFDYFGMGCRSVSRLFVPAWYDTSLLMNTLREKNITHPNYLNAYRHHKALLCMRQSDFMDGGFFTVREGNGTSEALPDLVINKYENLSDVRQWIEANDDSLQCIVSRVIRHPRAVDFGTAQQPELWDYPDGKDVMAFLRTIG